MNRTPSIDTSEIEPPARPVAVPLGLPSHCDKCAAPLDYNAGVFGGASASVKGFAGLRFCSPTCLGEYKQATGFPAETTVEVAERKERLAEAFEFNEKHGE